MLVLVNDVVLTHLVIPLIKAFPHPMSGLPIEDDKVANYNSYEKFGMISSAGFYAPLNRWRRRVLELPEIKYVIHNAITKSHIPYSAMWSPSFVPKPDDWPEQCRVVGTFFIDQKNAAAFDESEFAELSQWLSAGPPPVFLGFGSMVIEDTKSLAKIIKQAVGNAGCRMVSSVELSVFL